MSVRRLFLPIRPNKDVDVKENLMNPLAEILQDVRLSTSFFARSELKAPWGLAFSVHDGPHFHIIITGHCFLCISNEHIPLQTGDLVLLPHGNDHQLVSSPESAAAPLMALPSKRIGQNAAFLQYGGDGVAALLLCGGIHFAGQDTYPLLKLLPDMMVLHREELEVKYTWLETTLYLIETEALSPRLGSVAIMTHLTDILALQSIRTWLERDENRQMGWLGALRDPEIGHILMVIHRHPEVNWTVASLAQEIHLSRSIFAERFSRLVGTSPMHYVTQWRMSLASSWLREEHLSASEVAHRLGYSSEAAFSRAFKRHFQRPPGHVRRER